MKKLELILGFTAVLAIVLKLRLVLYLTVDTALLFCALTALSLFYLLFSFALFNDIRFRDITKKTSYSDASAKRILGAMALGVTISTIAIAALLKFLLFYGASELNLIGLMEIIIISILAIIFYFRSRASYFIRVLKRTAVFSILGFALLLTPNSKLVSIYYSDYPDYVELYKMVQANPEDNNLRYQLEQMEEEMFHPQ